MMSKPTDAGVIGEAFEVVSAEETIGIHHEQNRATFNGLLRHLMKTHKNAASLILDIPASRSNPAALQSPATLPLDGQLTYLFFFPPSEGGGDVGITDELSATVSVTPLPAGLPLFGSAMLA
jgi:hypothetical protein